MSLAKTAARKHRVPKALERRAEAIQRRGYDEQAAYAIATKASQREGRIKPGTHKLTNKGKGWETKHKKLDAQSQAKAAALPGLGIGAIRKKWFGAGAKATAKSVATRAASTPGLPKTPKLAQLLNDRPQEIEAAAPGASLGLSSRPGSGENIPDRVKADRARASKGLKKFRRHSAGAGQETKVIPHSVYDGERKKTRFSPSEFYSPHSN